MARHHPPTFTILQLCSGTLSMFLASRKILVPSILTFSLMSAVIAGFLQQSVSRIEDKIAAENSIEWQELHDKVQVRLAAFTSHDAEQLVHSFRTSESLSGDDLAFTFILAVGPLVAVALLLHAIVFFVACMFFLSLSTGALKSGFELAVQLPLFTLRMIAFFLWFFVRSFLWIPFIGPLLALYFIPRLLPAPFLYAGGHTSFFSSFQKSMMLSRKCWFKIVFALFCLFFITLALLWGGIMIVAATVLLSSKLSYFFWLLVLMTSGALQILYLSTLVRALE